MPIKDRDYRRYCAARRNAKRRGVPFALTFGEWLAVWRASGHYAEIGRRLGQYVMARHGDVGGYTTANVKIITVEQNHREQNQNPLTRAEQVARAKARHVAQRIERCGVSLSGRPSIAR